MGSINFKDSIITDIKGLYKKEEKTVVIKTYNNTSVVTSAGTWVKTTIKYDTSPTCSGGYFYYPEGPFKSGIVLKNFTGILSNINTMDYSIISSYTGELVYEIKVGDTVLATAKNPNRYGSNWLVYNYVNNVSGEIICYPSSELGEGIFRWRHLSFNATGTEREKQEVITESKIDKVYIGTEQIYP